jgi:hypothetical protein
MSSPFAPFSQFVTELRALLRAGVNHAQPAWRVAAEAALDGEAGRELARLVPVGARRRNGTFFTGSRLAGRLADRIPRIKVGARIIDPALGAGDLLLASARRSSRGRTVRHTLDLWTAAFAGLDREGIFVQAARLRLWLLAHVLHGVPVTGAPPADRLDSLECADLLKRPDVLEHATDILLNPPFSRIPAPDWFTLAGGKVNAAAIIADFIVRHVPSGARVHAILPEVLRTGSLYARWRSEMARQCDIRDVDSCGLFDSADVDVFMVTMEKRRRMAVTGVGRWAVRAPRQASALGELFEVSVGAVVDFRDPHEGPSRAYIHPRNVPVWREVRRINKFRAFQGTVVQPPFVVFRRTSRPGDKWRATGSIICGKRPVAVENHLLVCRPATRELEACRVLLRDLRTARINKFLDREMRCRHLIVDVVKRIPLGAIDFGRKAARR